MPCPAPAWKQRICSATIAWTGKGAFHGEMNALKPDPFMLPSEADRRRSVGRMRLVASGLLVGMACVFAAATHFQDLHPALPLVRAFAEAAMIGGLADWFAVTALFRRPLGLPIPHTAIIPRNKERIGQGLGSFVAENFLAPDLVAEKVASLDLSGQLQRWLAVPANRALVAARVVASVPDIIDTLDDVAVGRFLERNLSARLADIGLAPLAGELLGLLTAGGQHRQLVDDVLALLRETLARNQPVIAARVRDKSPWWLPGAVDAEIAGRITQAIDEGLADLARPGSPARSRLEAAVERLITELRHDPRLRAQGAQWLEGAFANPTVRAYFRDLAGALKRRLLADAGAAESGLARQIERALAVYAESIASDPRIKAKLDSWIVGAARGVAASRRHEIGHWIAAIVADWDSVTLVDKLELEVGRDLQFIRVNGTLVGGLVGLGIHLLSRGMG